MCQLKSGIDLLAEIQAQRAEITKLRGRLERVLQVAAYFDGEWWECPECDLIQAEGESSHDDGCQFGVAMRGLQEGDLDLKSLLHGAR